LTAGRTDLLEKFISKKGRPFKAFLVLKPDGKVGFEFEVRAAKKGGPEKPKEPPPKIDFSKAEPLAVCPICGGRVFETDSNYVCERTQEAKKPCKFKVGKTILQQSIDREQLKKLAETGRTDLLAQFISKAGKPFPAFLVVDDNQKISFEFPPK
jgi:DNA topoisomerase-3